MNHGMMMNSAGYRVHLRPIARQLDDDGMEMPREDDLWVIDAVMKAGVNLSNVRTGNLTNLGLDHIRKFATNRDQSQAGLRYGLLTLTVQITMQGPLLWTRPNAPPGKLIQARRAENTEKTVYLEYSAASELQLRLETAGYRVAWCSNKDLSRYLDKHDWEIVIEPDIQGVQTEFRLKYGPENQILIKRRNRQVSRGNGRTARAGWSG